MFSLISLFFLRWSSPNCFFSSIFKIYYWILSSGSLFFFLVVTYSNGCFLQLACSQLLFFLPLWYYFLSVVFCVWCLSLNRETSVIGVASLFLVCVSQKQKSMFSLDEVQLSKMIFFIVFSTFFLFFLWFMILCR